MAYSVTWAPFLRMVSQVPRPVPRCGIAESAKITAAHATTESQAETARDVGTNPC
jgi:hypothetical protein